VGCRRRRRRRVRPQNRRQHRHHCRPRVPEAQPVLVARPRRRHPSRAGRHRSRLAAVPTEVGAP
jgi:hypothetical protein